MYTMTSRYDADDCLILTCTKTDCPAVSMTYDGDDYTLRGQANNEEQEDMKNELIKAYDAHVCA